MIPRVLKRTAFLRAFSVFLLLAILNCLQGTELARAQNLAAQNAAMGMANTLNNQPVGGAPGATAAAAGAAAPVGATAAAVGNATGAVAGAEAGAAAAGATQEAINILEQYKPKDEIKVIEGDRVMDAYDKKSLLDDPQYRRYEKDFFENTKNKDKKTYSDDGETLGDQVARDNVYSRILRTKKNPNSEEFTGGISHYYLRKLIQVLGKVSETPSKEVTNRYRFMGKYLTFYPEPTATELQQLISNDMPSVEFFGLTATTRERVSNVEKEQKWNEDRNSEILKLDEQGNFLDDCKAKKFLDPYRKEKGKVDSEFYSLYVPVPPPPPSSPPPTGWMPPTAIMGGGAAAGAPAAPGAGGAPAGPGGGATVPGRTDSLGVSTQQFGGQNPMRNAVAGAVGMQPAAAGKQGYN